MYIYVASFPGCEGQLTGKVEDCPPDGLPVSSLASQAAIQYVGAAHRGGRK